MKKILLVTLLIAVVYISCDKEPANTKLVAHAQATPTHTLADNLSITLDGKGSTGNITAYAWECESYTANQGTVSAEYTKAQVDALITNANTATATVAPRKAGTYVFKLTVTGDEGESDTDTVAVVVEPAGTVQKDVTVSFPVFESGSITLSFAPTYTPAIAGGGFVNGDVTYTLEDNMGHTSNDFSSGVVNTNLYDDEDMPVFTQIFMLNDVEVGRQVIKVTVANFDSMGFYSLKNNEDNSISSIPSIDLHLEKLVTEL